MMTPDFPSTDYNGFRFDNSYTRLPDLLFRRQPPIPVAKPALAMLNENLAADLEVDYHRWDPESAAAFFSGNRLLPGSEPIAQAYAGHQYGHFTMLGDGRAILLGEHLTRSGKRHDIQLKGSGRTPFSRRGDGRAALGPMLRELLVSEGMHALGIPTTRCLAVVTTGESVWREDEMPGALMVRVAASHIRVGTFEYAARLPEPNVLEKLFRHTCERHFPEALDDQEPALAFLRAVLFSQARLVASWLHVGFVHGVMNTDNMALSGETLDFGPCAFLEEYHSSAVFSSIDRHGRYAYANQPSIVLWNLSRLAECLLPLIGSKPEAAVPVVEEVLHQFTPFFQQEWLRGMGKKLGISSASDATDLALVEDFLKLMADNEADFTSTFAQLTPGLLPSQISPSPPAAEWLNRWNQRLATEPGGQAGAVDLIRASNPSIIPRNHRVEQSITSALHGDWEPAHRLLEAVRNPFSENPAWDEYRQPAPPSEKVRETFCGT